MCDALKELFAEELKEENERGMERGIERGRAEGIHLAYFQAVCAGQFS